MKYEQLRDPSLPWGYWLRTPAGANDVTLVDDEGRMWSSVRSAFWYGRCGFKGEGDAKRDDQLEHLLTLLNVDPRDGRRLRSLKMDVGGDAPHAQVVSNWLRTSGLVEYDDHGSWTTTPEGHAVARMLIATRSPSLPAIHPVVEALHAWNGDRESEIDRTTFQRRQAGRMTFAFTRETIVEKPAISLLFRDVRAPLPLVRTLWAQTFRDETDRDAFFAWLARRADRWNAWGKRANGSGAHALTQHLVAIITAEFMTPHQAETPPGSAIEHRAEEQWRPQALALGSSYQEAGDGGEDMKRAHVDHLVCGQKMEAVYHVAELQPEADGPWRGEAEKIAWTDRSTGLSCICRRDAGGHLWGFTAVEPGHPLFGVDADAIPRTRIKVHGGLRYSALCDKDNSEALSICHVAPDQSAHDGTDEKWWFGFACDGIYDLIPNLPAHAAKARDLEIPQTYRNEPYVYIQTTDLAAQLAALASGERSDDRP